MVGDVFNDAEMGRVKFQEICFFEPGEGGFESWRVELRRCAGQCYVSISVEANVGGIACKGDVFLIKNPAMMVAGVARRVPGGQFNVAHLDALIVLHWNDVGFRGRKYFAPEFLHSVTIDSLGTSEKPRWIDKVACTPRMNVNPGALPRPPPSSASMIEVDVGEENILDCCWLESELGKTIEQGSES